MEFDTLTELFVDGLHYIQIALIPQSGSEQSFKALFLLRGGLRNGCIKHSLDQRFLIFLDVACIIQRIVNIGGTVVKSGKQKTDFRRGYRLVHGAIVKDFFLRNIVKIRLSLFHRANGTDQVSKGFVRGIILKGIILAFEGHIIGITAKQNQIVPFHDQGINDLFVEF